MNVDELKELSEKTRKFKGVVNKTTHARIQIQAWPDRPNALAYHQGMLMELRKAAADFVLLLEALESDLASELDR